MNPSPYHGGPADIAIGPNGARANARLIAHTEALQKRLYKVSDRIWSAVGFGMSNSILLKGPDGLIVVETGEGLEESREHLEAFRGVSQAPVRAVIYSHSHYAHGTPTWQQEAGPDLQIWGHAKILSNIANTAAEFGPAYARRARVQFSYYLPEQGEDAMPTKASA